MVPFQLVIVISSESERPYEHDSGPSPFSPFSSSSNSLKLLGLMIIKDKFETFGIRKVSIRYE